MATMSAPSSAKHAVNIPVDSIYDLQKSLSGVELLAYLAAEPVSEKKPSRLTDVAFHPVRPWLTAMDPKGGVLVWNYETKEIVTELSLDISQEGGAGVIDEDEEYASSAAPGTPTVSNLLAKTSSPTMSFVKASRSKVSSLRMLFYDHEAIQWTTKTSGERVVFEEWIIILTATHVVIADLNQPTAIRSISSEELQRQLPCSVELLPTGLLAIGCQDGKVRLWSPRQWRTVDTLESGSTKEVQQLLLLPLRTNATAADDTVVTSTSHYLVAMTLDGHVATWKVLATTADCAKIPGETDLRDLYRPFDTSSGIAEVRFHVHQEMVTAASKDGTVYFFDLTPLLRQGRQMQLVGVLPTTKLPGATVLAGSRKSTFVVVSMASSGSTLQISELINKGRGVGKDGLPANYHEYAVSTTSETRDLRVPVHQTALKKYRNLSLIASARDSDELCCVTSFGLFLLRATCLPRARSILIPRGSDKAPLLLTPGPSRISLKFYREETSTKQEDHKLQIVTDTTPNEKLKTPVLQPCPVNTAFVSALVPASTHVEIVQMDSELRNQKSINMHMVFSGNAIAIAWHATLPRFALLVPLDSNARRLTRAVSNINTPRRRGFMFGGSSKGGSAADEAAAAAAEAKLRNSMARAMTLSIYELTPDGHVQVVEEQCGCGDDRLLHVFSGPLLGVVKFEADDSGDTTPAPSTSFVGASEGGLGGLLSPSGLRTKRAESAVFSPTNAASTGATTASFSSSETDGNEFKRTTLEFYEWIRSPTGPGLKRVPSATPIDCPLLLEWERVTHRFCALVYPTCVKIYRVTVEPHAEVTCLHEIPTARTVRSLYWMHQTLFLATEDGITCCVLSKTRVFTFDLASRFVFTSATSTPSRLADASQLAYPTRQHLTEGATTILGIYHRQLVLAAPVQTLHTLELSNRVLQCCLLVSIGQPDLAVQVAEHLSVELCDWLGSVLEAFAFVTHALRLTKLSLRTKINIAIKHNLHEQLLTMVSDALDTLPVSTDLTGASLCQRACTSLHRGGCKAQLEELFRKMMAEHRINDAVFVATLLQKEELLIEAMAIRESSWGGVFQATKRSAPGKISDVLSKWNADISSATAPWKYILEDQRIRPPEAVVLLP